MKIISGIYGIEDVGTGNIYIGSANHKNGIKKRWSNHSARLRKGKYEYRELQEAFNDNEDRIKWTILEECPDEELEEREDYWKDYCSKVDGWHVINKQKCSIRHTVKDTSNMVEAQTGEGNGHNTKLSEENVFEILDMLKAGTSREVIARKFDIYPAYTYRIGKDRWVKAYNEWKEKNKVDCIRIQPTYTVTGITV